MKPQGCGARGDQSLMNTARGFHGIRIPLSVLQSGDMFNKFLKRQKKQKDTTFFLSFGLWYSNLIKQ